MSTRFSLPRLVIAAPQGRSGKTTVSLGLAAALAARGLAVQPFKKGPDYIDPSWLSAAAGRACRSLDPFFLPGPDRLRAAFLKGAQGAGLALVEGNHGLYDSSLPEDEPGGEALGSTAAVARTLGAPVLLVVNTARMGRSAAAMVRGYQTFEPGTPLAGIILNQVANARHEARLRQAIVAYCDLPVVGAIPRDESLTIPDRHLGLLPRGEAEGYPLALEACRRVAESYLDLEAILTIARSAPPLEHSISSYAPAGYPDSLPPSSVPPLSPGSLVTTGVLKDRAFSFYYPENLEALEEQGGRLVFIDAMQDENIPALDGLYIGGGFPEVFMEALEANSRLRQVLRREIAAGLPVYAECGGLMYLSQRIVWGERSADMVGALPYTVEMLARPQGHGYVLGEAGPAHPFLTPGEAVRGHEFHHSRLVALGEDLPTAYRLKRGTGTGNHADGLVAPNLLAGYTHLHAGGAPGWAPGFVQWLRGNR